MWIRSGAPNRHWSIIVALTMGILVGSSGAGCSGQLALSKIAPSSPSAQVAVSQESKIIASRMPEYSEGSAALEMLLAPMRARGAEPFCLENADADGDGANEWIGLRDSSSSGPAGVTGFVLDGNQYRLLGTDSQGSVISQRPICQVSVNDMNRDGIPEILARGIFEDGGEQLSVFQRNGQGSYPLLASFRGSEGVSLVDIGSASAQRIAVRNVVGSGIALEEVSEWTGAGFAFAYSRYRTARGIHDRSTSRESSPNVALISFYLALGDRDMATAYGLLSSAMRVRQSYEQFISSMAAVSDFELGELPGDIEADDSIELEAPLTIVQMRSGSQNRESYRGRWRMIRTQQGWRVDGISLVAERSAD